VNHGALGGNEDSTPENFSSLGLSDQMKGTIMKKNAQPAWFMGLQDGAQNIKGCDIGNALAISSCEGANNVEACTVTALDAITAFAIPNPNYSSQSMSVFSGLVAPAGCPVERITQSISG
jgi:hypothetical protein